MSDDRERWSVLPGEEARAEHRYRPGERVVDNEQARGDRREAVVIECHDERAEEFVFDEQGTTVAAVNPSVYPADDLVVSVAFTSVLDALYGSVWRGWSVESFTACREEHEQRVFAGPIEDRTYAYPQSRLLPASGDADAGDVSPEW